MSESIPFDFLSSSEPAAATPSKQRRLYRQGRLLVMHRKAVLPNRCIKSNAPADGRLKLRVTWHHPAIYLSIIFRRPLIYLTLDRLLHKRATIAVGLSAEWFRKRRRAIIIGWALIVVGLPMFIAGIALIDRSPLGHGGDPAGILHRPWRRVTGARGGNSPGNANHRPVPLAQGRASRFSGLFARLAIPLVASCAGWASPSRLPPSSRQREESDEARRGGRLWP